MATYILMVKVEIDDDGYMQDRQPCGVSTREDLRRMIDEELRDECKAGGPIEQLLETRGWPPYGRVSIQAVTLLDPEPGESEEAIRRRRRELIEELTRQSIDLGLYDTYPSSSQS